MLSHSRWRFMPHVSKFPVKFYQHTISFVMNVVLLEHSKGYYIKLFCYKPRAATQVTPSSFRDCLIAELNPTKATLAAC